MGPFDEGSKGPSTGHQVSHHRMVLEPTPIDWGIQGQRHAARIHLSVPGGMEDDATTQASVHHGMWADVANGDPRQLVGKRRQEVAVAAAIAHIGYYTTVYYCQSGDEMLS